MELILTSIPDGEWKRTTLKKLETIRNVDLGLKYLLAERLPTLKNQGACYAELIAVKFAVFDENALVKYVFLNFKPKQKKELLEYLSESKTMTKISICSTIAAGGHFDHIVPTKMPHFDTYYKSLICRQSLVTQTQLGLSNSVSISNIETRCANLRKDVENDRITPALRALFF